MNQDIKKQPKKRRTATQKKKTAIQKALVLLGLICVLGTTALLILQPLGTASVDTAPDSSTADINGDNINDTTADDVAHQQNAAQPEKQKSASGSAKTHSKVPATPPEQPAHTTKPRHQTEQPATQSTEQRPVEQQQLTPAAPQKPEQRPQKPSAHKGTLIFVFDDAGHNLTQLKPFLELPFPVTIAVLPGLAKTKEAAKVITAAGKELMLHQPMQAINLNVDPGPSSIQPGMTFSQITDILLENTAQLGSALKGINNHEGSLITEDPDSMRAVLEFCRDRGLYFLDSRTTAASVAQEQASLLNMTIWERTVFLDNTQDINDITAAVKSGMNIAEKKGNAILIGHIWSNTLAQTLQDLYPELVEQGFSMSTIAQIASYGE